MVVDRSIAEDSYFLCCVEKVRLTVSGFDEGLGSIGQFEALLLNSI
jgi:hypothetical protein